MARHAGARRRKSNYPPALRSAILLPPIDRGSSAIDAGEGNARFVTVQKRRRTSSPGSLVAISPLCSLLLSASTGRRNVGHLHSSHSLPTTTTACAPSQSVCAPAGPPLSFRCARANIRPKKIRLQSTPFRRPDQCRPHVTAVGLSRKYLTPRIGEVKTSARSQPWPVQAFPPQSRARGGDPQKPRARQPLPDCANRPGAISLEVVSRPPAAVRARQHLCYHLSFVR